MKILLVNKFFFSFGGSETAFFQAASLLRGMGHEVIFFSMAHPKNLESPQAPYFVSRVDFEKMKGWREWLLGVKRILFGSDARAKLDELLRIEKPDIAHLHNIYHHISPAIIGTLKSHGIPVVMTLHDYKPICPAYKLFTRGRICEKCRRARFFWCFLKKCVKNSYGKSLVCSLEAALHRAMYWRVDRFISPSLFLLRKAKEMGFAPECTYIANFTALPPFEPPPRAAEAPIVFFGRLVEEKGVSLLITALRGLPASCLIIGDGPEKKALQAQAGRTPDARIRFLGHQPFPALETIIRRACMVVVPSIWYENNPFAVMEAFAMGVPVVAARIGGIPELVIDGETGLLFRAGDSDDLRVKITALLQYPELGQKLAAQAYRHLQLHFSAGAHGEKLLRLYREVLAGNPPS